jgi:hypothetical protein
MDDAQGIRSMLAVGPAWTARGLDPDSFWDWMTRVQVDFSWRNGGEALFQDPYFAVLEFAAWVVDWKRHGYEGDFAFSPVDGPDNLLWLEPDGSERLCLKVEEVPVAILDRSAVIAAFEQFLDTVPELAESVDADWDALLGQAAAHHLARPD